MRSFENLQNNLDDKKRELIQRVNELNENEVIKLAKTLGFNKVEGSEEALRFTIESIKEAGDQDDLQTIQRKIENLNEIED